MTRLTKRENQQVEEDDTDKKNERRGEKRRRRCKDSTPIPIHSLSLKNNSNSAAPRPLDAVVSPRCQRNSTSMPESGCSTTSAVVDQKYGGSSYFRCGEGGKKSHFSKRVALNDQVYVDTSLIPNSGNGLFARVAIPAKEIICTYGGYLVGKHIRLAASSHG